MNYARRWNRRAASTKARRKAVKDQVRRGLLAERLEDRMLMAADLTPFLASFHSPYWNVNKPTDVTADGILAPNDALSVINMLNGVGPHQLTESEAQAEGETGSKLYVDVNNDGYVSPSDALQVINALNGEGAPPTPEVNYTVQVFAAGTDDPITSIQQGQDFDLQIVVSDLRNDGNPNRGVFSAFTDLLYDKSLAMPRVAEVQRVTETVLSGTSTFTLTVNPGQTTAPISFSGNPTNNAAIEANRAALQTGLNNLLGANTVFVTRVDPINPGFVYSVWFDGQFDVNFPKMTVNVLTGTGSVAVRDASQNIAPPDYQAVDGDITTPGTAAGGLSSFIEAFRSRDLPIGDTRSPYQNGLNAIDASFGFDEVGALAGLAPTGNFPLELVRVRMKANVLPAGTTSAPLTFTPDFTTIDHPSHDTLVYADSTKNESTAVPNDAIQIVPATITITSGPIHADPLNAGAINEDSGPDSIPLAGSFGLNQGSTGTAVLTGVGSLSGDTTGSVVLNGTNAVYTPGANFNGTATFTYTVKHVLANGQDDTGPGAVQTATVTVTVNAVNDKPTLDAISGQTINEDATGNVSLTGISAGPANESAQTLAFTVSSDNTTLFPNGSVTVNYAGGGATTGSLVLTPAANVSGTANITVTLMDNGGTANGGVDTTTRTFAVTVTAVNDAPQNLINGTDANSQHVVAVPNSTNFVFAPQSTFSVSDVDAGSANLTTTLTLSGSAVGTLHVNPAGVTVTGNDTASVQLVGSQTAISTALATLAFTPPTGSTSAETLTISTNDAGATGTGGAKTTTSTVTIDLDPGYRPGPIADSATVNEGDTTPVTIDVLANDFVRPSPTVTTITGVSTPAQGTAQIVNNKIVYTPPGGDFFTPTTPVTFTYTVDDDFTGDDGHPNCTGAQCTATVSVNIKNVVDTPVANNDSGYAATFSNGVGSTLTVDSAHGFPDNPTNGQKGVLANDTDVDNNFGNTHYATLTAVLVTNATKGTLNLNPDGTFTYTPTSFDQANPNDTFTYKVHAVTPEGSADSATATVTIHVTTPPVATNDHFNVLEQGNPASSGNVISGTGSSNPASTPDTDPSENQTLTAVLVSNIPANLNAGSVTLNPDGSFSYTPEPNQNFNTTRPPAADIKFTYKVRATDGRESNVATVNLTVQDVNDPPTAANDTYLAVKQNAGGTIGVNQEISVLPNDSIAPDVAIGGDESLTVVGISATNGSFGTTEVTTAGGGKVRLVNGKIFYDSPQTTGNDSFYYQISDNSSASRGGPLTASAKVDVTIVDFVPKTISGTVFLDTGNGLTLVGNTDPTAGNGVLDAGEKVLSGVTVHLTGTDFTNQTVSLTTTTDISGHYTFPAAGSNFTLKPPAAGTSYTITEDQPAFLVNGLDTDNSTNVDTTTHVHLVTNAVPTDNLFLIAWSITDLSGNVTGLNFGEGGIDVRSPAQGGSLLDAGLLKQEYLASSGKNGFIFELDTTGKMLWSTTLDPTGTAWAGTTSISASITGTDPKTGGPTLLDFTVGGETVSLGLGYNVSGSTARFRVLGIGPSGQYIIRVDGSSQGSSLTPGAQPYDGMFAANNGSGAAGEGEGEAPAVNAQYAGAADAVFTEKSWA